MINKTSGNYSPIYDGCNISVYNQLKYESVVSRKNELYIPLIEESLKLIDLCLRGNLFTKLDNSFMKEVIQKQYKYRVDDELLNKLKEIDDLVISYNKIDVIYISGNVIVNLFTKGFIKLFGDIIDGKAPVYCEDEIIDYEDVYPEEYENIRMIAYDRELIKDIVQQQDNCVVYEGDLYDRSLVTMFEFALATRNKKYSPSRTPIIDWVGAPEYYIASLCNFDDEFSRHKDILNKRNILKCIHDLCKDLSSSLDTILKVIFERYEKE